MLTIQLSQHAKNIIEVKLPSNLKICNPSIVEKDNQWIVLVRAIEEDLSKKNRNGYLYSENWILIFDSNFNLNNSYRINDEEIINTQKECQFGLEDGRIFLWKNELWILFSGLNIINNKFINSMCLVRLENDKLKDYKLLGSPHLNSREKNWIPFVKSDSLYFIYQVNPLEIFEYIDGQLQLSQKKKNKFSRFFISGSSTAIPYKNNYVFITHHRRKINIIKAVFLKITDKKKYKKYKIRFYHQFHVFNTVTNKIVTTKKFIFEKLGIEFCAGLAIRENKLYLSYGVFDSEAKIMVFDIQTFSKLFRNII